MDGENQTIMSFEKANLLMYKANNLEYPQKFAHLSFGKKKLDEESYKTIIANQDFPF